MDDVLTRIEKTINKIRPYIQHDGGDVEFIKFENGKCYVKLLGACTECDMADNTIKDMIEYT